MTTPAPHKHEIRAAKNYATGHGWNAWCIDPDCVTSKGATEDDARAACNLAIRTQQFEAGGGE